MKTSIYIYLVIILFLFFSCKKNHEDSKSTSITQTELEKPIDKDHTKTKNLNIKPLDKAISIELKQQQFIKKKDESEELETLIIEKHYRTEKKDYRINFRYPLLNEAFKPTHINFNNFLKDYYVNITRAESEILERKLLCDSIVTAEFREERFIDYKIYNINDQYVSVLFYKENFYNGAMHPSYSFDCFNFDLESGVFMVYEDFFIEGSEEELVTIINQNINEQIDEGNLYYDCWEVSLDDFLSKKNNFVLNDTYIEFYFDDCIICPSYTGTYSVELQLTDLLSVLKKHELNPLAFQK